MLWSPTVAYLTRSPWFCRTGIHLQGFIGILAFKSLKFLDFMLPYMDMEETELIELD